MGKNPAWTWYIVWDFFFGSVAAGAYMMAAFADIFGREEDRRVTRVGYVLAFPLVVICAILLTLDLGMPARTFNMLRLFKWGSPMSVGSWALLGFGLFSLASLILVLAEGRAGSARALAARRLRQAVAVPGMLLGFFIASYTGVLLGATNRPMWGGNNWIGPLFLTSAALTGVAVIALWPRRARLATLRRLYLVAIALQAVALVIFLQSLGAGAALFLSGAMAPLFWGAVVVAGVAAPLLIQAFVGRGRGLEVVTAALVLIGGFALRYLILLSGQT